MKPDLTTRVKNLILKNPITVASGTFGTMDEYAAYVNPKSLGAIITKTITVKPRVGNPMPRICETASGMLNAIGLQNKGLEDFLEHKIPYFKKLGVPLIVSIAGETTAEFTALAKAFDRHWDVVSAIEINLSCPNVEAAGVSGMKKLDRILNAVKAVREGTSLLAFAKLSPELGDLLSIAGEVLKCGADGLSVINTLRGMSVDIRTRGSRLARDFGGLSGPAIKPVALRYVYQVKKEFQVPVIASGGIANIQDALEFLIVGADLLAVGTANFVEPGATVAIIKGLEDFCRKEGIVSLDELRGTYKTAMEKGKGCQS